MTQPPRSRLHTARTLKASAVAVLLGLALLLLIGAMDRASWFRLRPASGTAAAMHHASVPPAGEQPAAPVRP